MDGTSRISELRRALLQQDPGGFLVEPRVIRRIIRELHGYARLSTSIPHTESQVVLSHDVRELAHPDELGLTSFGSLPPICLLIAQPEEHELQHWPTQELLQLIWRRLFHGSIDRVLRERTRGPLTRAEIQKRIAAIGQVEFDEAHFVLNGEQRLVDAESRVEGYCEFVAMYLELQRFSPDLLAVWFPSLAGRGHVEAIIAMDVNADSLYHATQLYGAPPPDLTSRQGRDEARLTSTRHDWTLGIGAKQSDRMYLRQLRRRDRALEKGNTVGAATCAMRAVECATTDDKRNAAREKARTDVNELVRRLRSALQFTEADESDWKSSLWELVTNSIHGFWNADKRLLFDLQKICLDHERVIYKIDLVKWIVSRGRRPLRRALTSVREVMMAKHLASCASRLVHVRLSGRERDRLDGLLHEAAHLAEEQMRQRMRPALQQTLLGVGLQPDNLPGQVALDKLIEDSLDCIAHRGYLTMGYLRDAISRNDLKLPDLKHASELIRGDHLLRADDRLDVALDGVYRRGEFYLRWLQITSSLFFGTPVGRFATLFLIIPFGGAKVIVVAGEYVVHLLTGHSPQTDSSLPLPDEPAPDADDSIELSELPGSLSEPDEPPVPADDSVSERGADGLSPPDDQASPEPGTQEPGTPEPAGQEPGRLDQAMSVQASSPPQQVAALGRAFGLESDDIGEAGDEFAMPVTLTAMPTIDESVGEPVDEDVRWASEDEPASAVASTNEPATATSTESVSLTGSEPVDMAFRQVINREISSLSLVLAIGFVLMGLIHVPAFRNWGIHLLKRVWKVGRLVLVDVPLRILRLPIIQSIWRNRMFVRIRRVVIHPLLFSFLFCFAVPWVLGTQALNWAWMSVIAVLLSLALNSRLGRDAEELTSEWLAAVWYNFRARILVAVVEWVIDLFKTILGFVERCLYAVDEWLRFHNAESWLTVIAKAVLGVIWSFASFLIRIYVNLLIEPTFHPVKHFPVVTVAHKMLLPFLMVLQSNMRTTLSPYLGEALATSFTWFTIFFLPGLFGFAVWELKENWRLYEANRKPNLYPSLVGSHGESLPRLLRPGFHSGTLPKLFRRMRKLEQKETSFRRFSLRRATREKLEHAKLDVRRFVQREFLHLLELTSDWRGRGLRCGKIQAASNSVQIQIECDRLGNQPLTMLFQEQSGWAVATVSETGWLRYASAEQTRVLEHALEGFYRKAGIELVREQMQQNLIQGHEYDINSQGLAIWPDRQFQREIHVDLNRQHLLRPVPAGEAARYGLQPVERRRVVFNDSTTTWEDWKRMWQPAEPSAEMSAPIAATQHVRLRLIRPNW